MALARRAASAGVRRRHARTAGRTARGDQRPTAGSRRAPPPAGAGEPAGRDLRRGAPADRERAGGAGADDGADHQRHGHAVGPRLGLGDRARARIPGRGAAPRGRGRRGVPGRAGAADVGRRRPLARHRLLHGFRSVSPGRVRLVDVPGVRTRRLHPLRARRSDGGAGQPHRELQRVPAQSAVGGGMDRRTGSRTPNRRRAGAAATPHEAGRDGPSVHRARARGGGHTGSVDRSGCRRQPAPGIQSRHVPRSGRFSSPG